METNEKAAAVFLLLKTKANRNIRHKSRKGGQIAITYVDDKKSKKILVAVTVPFRFQLLLQARIQGR